MGKTSRSLSTTHRSRCCRQRSFEKIIVQRDPQSRYYQSYAASSMCCTRTTNIHNRNAPYIRISVCVCSRNILYLRCSSRRCRRCCSRWRRRFYSSPEHSAGLCAVGLLNVYACYLAIDIGLCTLMREHEKLPNIRPRAFNVFENKQQQCDVYRTAYPSIISRRPTQLNHFLYYSCCFSCVYVYASWCLFGYLLGHMWNIPGNSSHWTPRRFRYRTLAMLKMSTSAISI